MEDTTRVRAWTERVAGVCGLRLVLWLGVAWWFAPGLWADPYRTTPHHDEHYFVMQEEAARRSIVEFGQLPVWNPYYGGGMPALANPQVAALSPDFALRLAFGTLPGRRLALLLLTLLGMEGTFRLARRLGLDPPGALFAAVVYPTSGWFAWFIAVGWVNFHVGFQLLPWAALAFLRATAAAGRACAARTAALAFLLAWMVLCGGTYTAPYAVVVLGGFAFVVAGRAVAAGRPVAAVARPFGLLLGAGLLAAALAAVRLLPMLRVVVAHPRVWLAPEVASPERIASMLLSPDGAPYAAGYLGLPVALLAAVAVLAGDRRARLPAAGAAVFLLLALGDHGIASPYHWLDRLPLLGQLRDPPRYTIVAGLFLALAAGRGVDLLARVPAGVAAWLARRTGIRAGAEALAGAGLVLALAVGALAAAHGIATNRIRPEAPHAEEPLPRHRDAFRQARGNRWDAHVWVAADRGSLQAFEEIPFPVSAELRADLAQEEYPLDPAAATVRRVSWSPHELVLRVEAARAATVRVNQNFHPAWTTTVGAVRSDRGLLAVDVPAGAHEVVLRHRDPWVRAGLVVSLATLAGLLVAAALARRRRATRT